jgi:hypothetical protein
MTDSARMLAGLLAFLLATPALAQTPFTVSVQGHGELPGFRIEEAGPYLAAQMNQAGITAWRFASRDPNAAAPNRVEWQFELQPYAGGQVRQLFRMPEGRTEVHLQGTHRLISAQARLYLNGEYQTVVIGQEAVQGGDQDADLSNFLIRLTKDIDSAYRAIDMGAAVHNRAAP